MKLKKLLALAAIPVASMSLNADHQWASYHWAITPSGTLTLASIDNVSSDWQQSYETALSKWEQQGTIVHVKENGSDSSRDRKRCSAVSGKMKVCNAAYGNNGWAGLASINIDSNGHITQGTAKMNDTYMANYDDVYRNHVMCQEIGHVYGLGHTSEDGSSQSTCMDYSPPDNTSSQWPNNHDYQLLSSMYSHDDGYNTSAAMLNGGGEDPKPCRGGPKKCGNGAAGPAWGVKVLQKGRMQIWVAPGKNNTTWIHHVTLAEGYDDIVHDGDDHH
jgi:hypothetical protein